MRSLRGLLLPRTRTLVQVLDAVSPGVLLLLLGRLHHIDVAEPYWTLALVQALAIALVFSGLGVYRHWTQVPRHHHVQRLIIAWGVVMALLLVLAYAAKISAIYSRLVVLAWALLTPVLLVALHLALLSFIRAWHRSGHSLATGVVIGGSEPARRLVRLLQNDPTLGVRIVGYFDEGPKPTFPVSDSEWPPYLGTAEQVAAYVKAQRIERVYVALSLGDEPQIAGLLYSLRDSPTRVYLVPDLFVFGHLDARLELLSGIPLVALAEPTADGSESLVKRSLDLTLATAFILLGLPLFGLIALAIKLTSSGPVLFKQRRYGLDGEPIYIYKFRTMTVCEDGNHVPQARRRDARITPLGGMLRATSLDELPQLFNVLQGRMSLVGPRPHAVAHNEFYRQHIPEYMLRHKVKPGMTGWAQVHGLRGETDTLDKMCRRVEYDLYYIRHWSLLLDIHILLQTVRVLLRTGDAY